MFDKNIICVTDAARNGMWQSALYVIKLESKQNLDTINLKQNFILIDQNITDYSRNCA